MPPSPQQSFLRWSEQPMFFAALAFACGIVAQALVPVAPRDWVIGCAALLTAAALLSARQSRMGVVMALACFTFLGGGGAALATKAEIVPPDISAYTAETMEITAHVTSTALPRFDEQDRELRSVQAEVESVGDGTVTTNVSFGARLTIHDNGKAIPDLKYGDRIRFIAKLREPRNYGNPGAMDYRGYLRDKGIIALVSVPSTSLEVMSGKVGTWFGFWRATLRRSFLDHMLMLASDSCVAKQWTCMEREDVGVLAAMVIGEQSLLERSTKVDFQKTGAFHVLVVSGMNVGIVAFVVFWMCRRLRTSEWIATIATIVLTLFYAYLTDMGAPILRAALMLALYLMARMLYRQRYSLNSIGTAALVLLVIWPRSLFDPSFQLTFLAVAALGGMVQPLLERTLLPYSQALRGINLLGYDTALEPKLAQLRLDVRLIAVKLGVVMGSSKEFCAKALSFAMRGTITFLELVIVTAAMQVALALPMVWYFHRLSAVGVPANIAIVPLTTLLMPLAIVASLLAFAGATAAKVLAVPTALLLHAVTATTGWLAHAHGAHFRVASPVVPVAIACAGIFLLSLFAFKRSRASAWAATISLLFAAVLLVVPRAPDYRAGALEITAVDVGQGDSLLLVEPRGGTLLIDGGGPPGFVQRNSFDVGEDVVSPYLWSRGFSRIDAVVLTHAHSDHMDGLRSVIANFKPREIWLAGEVPAALAEIVRPNSVAVRQLHAGDTIKFGAADFGVLAAGAGGESLNDTSVVLHVSYGESSALLLGDAEKELEKRIATDMRRVDVMKVAHHGSATSTTPELLKNARPHYAVISVGAQNPYRHPRAEVIERLRNSGTVTYRTDTNGATTFYLDGERVLADSYLLAPPIAPEHPGPRQEGSRGTPR